MADEKETKSEERDKRIPVFTVLKNNTILKNIFLLENPPLFPEPKPIKPGENGDPPVKEFEETLLVGRHPDCNITLEHPSISRFHLRIHSKPSSQKLSVIDLSSVHGTWISEKKIEPGVRVELNEGDTMQLGGSSRVYRLHWVPLSRAYDMENPFVSPLFVSMQNEDCSFLENNQIQSPGDDSEGIDLSFPDEKSKSLKKNVIPSAPPSPEYMNSPLFSDEEVEKKSTSKKDHEQKEISSPSSRQLATGSWTSSLSVGVLSDNQSPRPSVDTELLSENKNPETSTGELERILNFPERLNSPFSHEQRENLCSLREDQDQGQMLSFFNQPRAEESVNSSLPSGIVIWTIDDQQLNEENQTPEPLSGTEGLSGIENPGSHPARPEQKSSLPESLNSSLSDEQESHQIAEALQIAENRDPLRVDHKQREIPLLRSEPLATESVNSSLPVGNVHSEIESQQFNKAKQSPRTPFATGGSQKENPESRLIKSEQKPNFHSIWSSRGKSSSVLQIQTGRNRGKSNVDDINDEVELPHQEDIKNNAISKALFGLDGDEEAFTTDKENCTPNTLILRSMKNMDKIEQIKDSMSYRSSSLKNKVTSNSKGLFTGEPFSPDKENFTSNTLLLRSMRKMGKVEEIKHPNLHSSCSLENAVNPKVHLEEEILPPSVQEKQTPKEWKSLRPSSRKQESSEPDVMAMKRRAERVPFQPLLVSSGGRSKSGASVLSATTKSSNYMNYAQTIEKNNSIAGEKRRWNMVVDITCLLNKESRKALQLLQGLKGTQLIIPRIVIRELDCLKRRGSLFRRKTEVSSALQWIEECMVNTNWWIHVQSSEEEGRHIAPTPPASPQSRYSEGNIWFPGGLASSVPFSAWGSSLEIVSPTAEDHILECALLFSRNKNGQLVLLTNEVTLKIKAMAEGLISETAEAFRESLVNPFSDRFLWTDSSPRGPTWFCVDDIVLREKYYSYPSRKPLKSAEGAKGLKLILLHNSHYAQTLVS